jgi:hypothetical protein
MRGTGMFSVGVPVDSDPEFKTYVFAVGVTHSMGNQSIDYQLRRNYEEWLRRHLPSQLLAAGSTSRLLHEVKTIARARCLELSSLDLPVDAVEGLDVAANALIRLESTFRAAVQLVRLGFAFEAEAVMRLGFEQVSWAHCIARQSTPEEIVKISPTRCTTKLKEIFVGAGRIYNRLSNFAHASPLTHSRVVATHGDHIKIQIKSPEATIESAFLLIVLLDAFLVVSEKCFLPQGLACSSIDSTSGLMVADRKATALVSEYAAVLPTDAVARFQSWWQGPA